MSQQGRRAASASQVTATPDTRALYTVKNRFHILARLIRFAMCLPPAEFKVLMFICDRTFAFRKWVESIPYRHFFEGITTEGVRVSFGCGYGETTLKKALCSLEKRGLIIREHSEIDRGTYYAINTKWVPDGIYDLYGGDVFHPDDFYPALQDAFQPVEQDE